MLEKLITADVSACTGLSVGHDSQLCPSQSTFAKKKLPISQAYLYGKYNEFIKELYKKKQERNWILGNK